MNEKPQREYLCMRWYKFLKFCISKITKIKFKGKWQTRTFFIVDRQQVFVNFNTEISYAFWAKFLICVVLKG